MSKEDRRQMEEDFWYCKEHDEFFNFKDVDEWIEFLDEVKGDL